MPCCGCCRRYWRRCCCADDEEVDEEEKGDEGMAANRTTELVSAVDDRRLLLLLPLQPPEFVDRIMDRHKGGGEGEGVVDSGTALRAVSRPKMKSESEPLAEERSSNVDGLCDDLQEVAVLLL